MGECNGCGSCCKKHWLLKLTNKYEIEFFKDNVVYGEFIWTDQCPHLKDNQCSIHGTDSQPHRCKEFSCEGRDL